MANKGKSGSEKTHGTNSPDALNFYRIVFATGEIAVIKQPDLFQAQIKGHEIARDEKTIVISVKVISK